MSKKDIQKEIEDIKSEQEKANNFINSARGSYILSQALYVASTVLKETEPSNATDMLYIHDNLLSMYGALQKADPRSFENIKEEVEGKQAIFFIENIMSEKTGKEYKYTSGGDKSITDLIDECALYLFKKREIFSIRSCIIKNLLDSVSSAKLWLEEQKGLEND